MAGFKPAIFVYCIVPMAAQALRRSCRKPLLDKDLATRTGSQTQGQ